jgi:hypothetical protein
MHEGRILQAGAPGDTHETPASRSWPTLGNVNLMDGRLMTTRRLRVMSAQMALTMGHGIQVPPA